MKKFILPLLMSAVLLVSGCSFLDPLLLKPATDQETGEKLYVDEQATEERDDGKEVLVRDSDRVPDREYSPAYSGEPSSLLQDSKGPLSTMLGPWGALVLSFLGTGYAAIRGKRKLNSKELEKQAAESMNEELVELIENVKRDLGSGVTDVETVKKLVRKYGGKISDPVLLTKLVKRVEKSFK